MRFFRDKSSRWHLIHLAALMSMLGMLSAYQRAVAVQDTAPIVKTVYRNMSLDGERGQLVTLVEDRFYLHWVGSCNDTKIYGCWHWIESSKIVLEAKTHEQFKGEFMTVDGKDCLLVGTMLMHRVTP